jgi:hypothetical protein
LQRSADDPSHPIVFEPVTNEFHITHDESKAISIVYHCPFCGGAAPKSKRHLLFAVIPPEEEKRLAQLLAPITTLRAALNHLGKPAIDNPSGAGTFTPERDGCPPIKQHHRTLLYDNLSPVANVHFTERLDGTAMWQLFGKYVGPPNSNLK